MVCLALLIYFINHVAQAIQAPNVIASVARELERSIRRHFPEAREPVERPDRDDDERFTPPGFEASARPIVAATSGYLQVIDHETLMATAAARDLLVRLERRPGDFVIADGVLAMAWPPGRVDDEAARRCGAAS